MAYIPSVRHITNVRPVVSGMRRSLFRTTSNKFRASCGTSGASEVLQALILAQLKPSLAAAYPVLVDVGLIQDHTLSIRLRSFLITSPVYYTSTMSR